MHRSWVFTLPLGWTSLATQHWGCICSAECTSEPSQYIEIIVKYRQ